MKTGTTLKQISNHLNISISTVSRALKDHPDVSTETKKRVKELANLLDYEPNAFAVSLRKQNSNLFAVIVPEIGNYFYHDLIHAIETESRKMNHSLLILQSMNDPETEEQNLRICRHNHVAGIFLAITEDTKSEEPFIRLQNLDIPLVFVDKTLPDSKADFSCVCIADESCGEMGAELLHKSNADKLLAIMGPPNLSITKKREAGFRKKLQELNSTLPLEMEFARSWEEARDITRDYLEKNSNNLTGIFAMSDEVMVGVQKAIATAGLKMPDQVKLLAVSNGFMPALYTPEIDYLRTNGYDLGLLSFGHMMEIKKGKKNPEDKMLDCLYVPGGTL